MSRNLQIPYKPTIFIGSSWNHSHATGASHNKDDKTYLFSLLPQQLRCEAVILQSRAPGQVTKTLCKSRYLPHGLKVSLDTIPDREERPGSVREHMLACLHFHTIVIWSNSNLILRKFQKKGIHTLKSTLSSTGRDFPAFPVSLSDKSNPSPITAWRRQTNPNALGERGS